MTYFEHRNRGTSLLPRLFIIMAIFASLATGAENHGRIQPWLVKAVTFTGNDSISSSDLLGSMDTKPSRLFHKVKFSQSLLNADIETIADLYRDKGFLNVQVRADGIVKDPLARRVTVTIAVSEGPQTRIGSVAIEGGNAKVYADIKRIILAKPFAPYSMVRLAYDQQTIRDCIIAQGYALCSVDRKDSMDSVTHTASVSFLVDQGPIVVAGPLTIGGTKKLRTVIVKRGLTFGQGDTLTTGQIDLSARQLYESGMVKYVQIAPQITDSAQQRRMPGPLSLPVLVNIEEEDFYKVQGGVGYGTYEGVRLSLQTSYGNVLGLGRTIGLDGKYSRLVQSLHLNYIAPWSFLLPPTAEAEVYGEHHDEVTFTGYLEGTTLSLLAKTGWNLGYRVFTTFEWVQGVATPPLLPTLAPLIHGNNTQSFGTGFTYDIRDNIFDPQKGLLAASDAALAGLVGTGTNHFYKIIMDLRGYVPVGHFLDVASAAMAGYVNGYGIDKAVVPPQELFYAGSQTIRPVRGYAPGGVGDSAGGRLVLVVNALELRFAIVKWLKIAGFADAGFVWASKSLFNLQDLRWTAGPGLRIRTPIGLLSTDLGVRLNGPTRGKFGFSISIGEPF
jgi:outer membrane protein insertion porin family